MPGMRSRHDVEGLERYYPGSRQGGASSSGWHQEFEEMQGHMGRGPPGRGAAGPSTRFPSQAALAPFLQVGVTDFRGVVCGLGRVHGAVADVLERWS